MVVVARFSWARCAVFEIEELVAFYFGFKVSVVAALGFIGNAIWFPVKPFGDGGKKGGMITFSVSWLEGELDSLTA